MHYYECVLLSISSGQKYVAEADKQWQYIKIKIRMYVINLLRENRLW